MLRVWRAACVLLTMMFLTAAGPVGAQAQSAADIDALNKRVVQLYGQGKYAEATTVAQQALTFAERVLGRSISAPWRPPSGCWAASTPTR